MATTGGHVRARSEGAFADWVRAHTEPYSMFRVSASVASLIAREFHVGEADTVSFHRCRPRCFSARAVWFCQLPGELYTWLPLVAMSGHVANWCIRRLGACPYRTLQHVPCLSQCCFVDCSGISRR